MTHTIPSSDDEIGVAWSAAHTGRYPAIKERINVYLATHPNYKRTDGTPFPFVRMGDIPERFHAYIKKIAIGSNAPAPDDARNSYWQADIDCWLRAIGVKAEFIAPKHNP